MLSWGHRFCHWLNHWNFEFLQSFRVILLIIQVILIFFSHRRLFIVNRTKIKLLHAIFSTCSFDILWVKINLVCFSFWRPWGLFRSLFSLIGPDAEDVAKLGFLVRRKLLLEHVRLEHSLFEQTVLEKQLLDHLVAKVEVIYTVPKLLLRYDVAATRRARACNCKSSFRSHFHDFFHAKDLVFAEKVKLESLLLVGRNQSFNVIDWAIQTS